MKALLVRINVAIGTTSQDDDSENLCRGLKERRRKIMGILYKAETEDIPDDPDIATDRAICNSEPIFTVLMQTKYLRKMLMKLQFVC